jgi:RNA polymerase sigma factor (sigma-70 family)
MRFQLQFAEDIVGHLPLVQSVVFKMMRGDQAAEGVVQQTMLKSLTCSAQFRFESSLKTWLTTIATNEVYQVYRSKRWRSRAAMLVKENFNCRQDDSTEKGYEAQERDRLVRHAVSKLPHPHRCVVELCILQQSSLQKSAQALWVVYRRGEELPSPRSEKAVADFCPASSLLRRCGCAQ